MKDFIKYFKLTNLLVKKAIKKEGLIKFYLYYIMKILFSFSIFLSPFRVSEWALAHEIKDEDCNISLTGLFESATGKGYFHLLIANIIKLAIFLGILILIALFGGIMYLIGFGIYYSNTSTEAYFPFFFLIPSGILAIILFILLPFISAPNSYIVNKYPTLTPGRVLKYSFYAFKNGGRKKMLLVILLEYITKLLFLGLGTLLSMLPLLIMRNYIGLGITIIIGAIALALYLIIAPKITLISILMRSDIYDEIVFVKNSNKITEINISEHDILVRNDNGEVLNSLFKIEKKIDISPSYQNSLDENIENKRKKDKQKEKELKIAQQELDNKKDDVLVDNNQDNIDSVESEPIENNDIENIEYQNNTLLKEETEETTVLEELQEEQAEDIKEPEIEEIVKEEVEPQEEVVQENEEPEVTETQNEEDIIQEEPTQEETEVQDEAPVENEDSQEETTDVNDLGPEEVLDTQTEENTITETEEPIESNAESEKIDVETNIVENSVEEVIESTQEEQVEETTLEPEALEDNKEDVIQEESQVEEINELEVKEEVLEKNESEVNPDQELEDFLNSIPEKDEKNNKKGKKKKDKKEE